MAFSSLTMKIESTAPTAVSSVQPGRTGSFKSRSLAGPGAGCRPSSSHHTSFPEHIRHSLVRALSHPCHCGVVTLSLTPYTVHLPRQTHSLSPMCFPFGQQGSTGQGGQGESPSCSRSWLSSDSRTGPAVSHADMQQHAASGCMQNHNKPRPAGDIVRVANIKELLWSTFTLEIFPKELKGRYLAITFRYCSGTKNCCLPVQADRSPQTGPAASS